MFNQLQKLCFPVLAALTLSFAVGCGGDTTPEDAPPTPEPGSEDYDQYYDAGKGGPGGGHGGAGGHGGSK